MNSKAITKKLDYFAVNLLGNPNDFKIIQNLIKNTEIILIEDNCRSMDTFEGKKTGTFGLLIALALTTHIIFLLLKGFITLDDEELYHIFSIEPHGWTRNLPDKNKVTNSKNKDSLLKVSILFSWL